MIKLSRRALIASVPILAGSAMIPSAWAATSPESRLLVINLRGALDGLAAIVPVGDPALGSLRAALNTQKMPGLPLDSMFELNGNLSSLYQLYQAKEALFFHAVATPYRSRSHFDAQMVLESGQPNVGGDGTGWLNRALAVTPMLNGQERLGKPALTVSPTVPLMLRGSAPVESWQPQVLQQADLDLAARLLTVYEARDAELAKALRQGVGIDTFLGEQAMSAPEGAMRVSAAGRFATTMEAVGRLLAEKDGPRVAAMAIDGWDTHASQGSEVGRLATQFRALDAGIAALKLNMGALWKDTVVVIVTEFGRTARANGSAGTDHGTGGIAMLVGGRVMGGRVLADWPGLDERNLFEGRDLMPTMDLRGVLKGVLSEGLGLDQSALAQVVFPDSRLIKPVTGLLRL